MIENFHQINIRYQTIDPGSSERTPSKINTNEIVHMYITFKLKKIKHKKKFNLFYYCTESTL